ncbi:MAG: FHA domain-containing protein [Chloroflexi bacterium]|nr:FHA domain-containing protein [Chloroflexota bacterium]MCA2000402.1 FHA domain-containing protein [Chloroflexota bacterium]
MSGVVLLVLRLFLAVVLYGFLGWALFLLWRDIHKQGTALANRRVPNISLSVRYGQAAPIIKNFTQPAVTIGRDPGCDLPLPDDAVSTRHAQLTHHHNQWWLEDLGSTNGTTLNQSAVTMPTVLTAGDEIQCGNTRLTVNLSTNTLVSPTQRLDKKS